MNTKRFQDKITDSRAVTMGTTMPLTVLEAHWLTPSFLCTHHLLHPQHYLYCQLFPFTLIIIVIIAYNHDRHQSNDHYLQK